MKHTGKAIAIMLSAVLSCGLGMQSELHAQTAKITIDVNRPGIEVSKMLYGAFFEEINRAGDGGLYAEMIQNRSFEDVATIPVAWDLIAMGGAKVTWSVDRSAPLNTNNQSSLKLDVQTLPAGARAGVANAGFVGTPKNWKETDAQYAERFAAAVKKDGKGHGIAVQAGADYLASLYIRQEDAAGATVTISLEKADGTVLASGQVANVSGEWKKYPVFLKASAGATDAKLVVSVDRPGTYRLDMVSLFPKETFLGRENGLRKDLAEKVQAMKPAFMRFPGGCFVEGETLDQSVRWKETIGDVAQRPGRVNLWGYRSSDGLGMFEYLQFCEDIGAEPLFVINCGMSHKGHVPLDQMDAYVQDAVDAIEYCNGPADSTWGAKRAAAGHPKPFNLKYIEVGNENGGPVYHERFALIVDAIKKKYPDINIIANDWGGVPTNRPFELKDEHYYDTPHWFMNNGNRYDSYPRTGAKVYVGEYAVTHGCGGGNLIAAIGESVFMMGMERNSDVVAMASYAPLFAEPNWKRWNPNAINFDGSRIFATPSYYVQAMFANHRPDVIVPAVVSELQIPQTPPQGRIGIGTWHTEAEFKDIEVVAPDGKVLWKSDGAKGIEQFTERSGNWSVEEGAFRQHVKNNATYAFAGSDEWKDYTLKLKARKISGDEGFMISFHSMDSQMPSHWNLGGWGNKLHGIQAPGVPLKQIKGTIEAGKWYDIQIDLRGKNVTCYLNGEKIQEVEASSTDQLYAAAGIDLQKREVILKVANPTQVAVRTSVDLRGAQNVNAAGRAVVLTSENLKDENSLDQPNKVAPREETFKSARQFDVEVAPRSVSVYRVGIN